MLKIKNKKIFSTILFLSGFFLYGNYANAEALNLPKDENGWTIFTPSDDSRIMYVSEEGNDSTGTVYDDDDVALGGNPLDPTGPINSFATYAAAYANARNGYPDWILFKRGDMFYQTVGSNIRNGRSEAEPFLVGAYGSSGPSPLLKIGSLYGINIARTSPSSPWRAEFIAISGVRFYTHTRNPQDPEYIGDSGGGFNIIAYNPGNEIKNILIEGCSFSYQSGNSLQSGNGAELVKNIDIRRNIFAYSYSNSSHSQGFYSYLTDNILLEENIFDHNGWYSQAGSGGVGEATMFNHNTYFASVSNNIFRGNIFMRPSSMQNKFTAEYDAVNNVIENNLYIDGEIGIGMGTNYLDHEWRFINPTISNNVFTNMGISNPTARGLAWTLQMAGWDGGIVKDNLVNNKNINLHNSYALAIDDQSRNVNIYNNTFFTHQSTAYGFVFSFSGTSSNINIYDNYLEMPGNGDELIDFKVSRTGFNFNNNQYYDSISPIFSIQNTDLTTAQWKEIVEPSAIFSQRTFLDDTRSIETYQASIGEAATLDAFMNKARSQDRYNWDTRYMANVVNNYIRAGFVFDDVASPGSPSGLTVL